MIQKKICMVGAFAVGKTSLVTRFVKSIFSEKYLTTVGVKIDKKEVRLGDAEVTLVLWDIAGEDNLTQMRMSYLRGASGYLLVVDGTRPGTLETAITLQKKADEFFGKEIPFVLLLNKRDLADIWGLADETVGALVERHWTVMETSAKTGQGVEEAFLALTRMIVGASGTAMSTGERHIGIVCDP